MGCICSFFRTLTSYHGSHLTAHQVSRQRQQRLRQARPTRDSPPPLTPEKPPLASPFPAPTGRAKGAGEEEKLLPFNPSKKSKLGDTGKQEEKLLTFNVPKKNKLSECGKQASFSQSKFSTTFNKS